MHVSTRASRRAGFTLIELLIVVAIIAILAAIAVPNFLEAQTRAKVARAKSDMRSMATALEAYRVDFNTSCPQYVGITIMAGTVYPTPTTGLSTPVAYMTTSNLPDPFQSARMSSSDIPDNWGFQFRTFYRYRDYFGSNRNGALMLEYATYVAPYVGEWTLTSFGPDAVDGPELMSTHTAGLRIPYDPTNGTVSAGDVIRSQKFPEGYFFDVFPGG